ncbi:MAG TPA: UvrD-helicase domain-containing protein [Polyangia bacterium]|nr:UvrD-helicase domain-containing protein [Polyangia bacterium]
MPAVTFYPKPDELGRLPRDRSAVIEASAGTGKTYLLEHLVLDRIVDGDTRIENILVVTFTDKGAAELGRRLRAAIDRLLRAAAGADPPPAGDTADPARCWRLDAGAVARLQRARQSFDRATIATMHGFCQQVLTENPFASQRLFAQRHVDSRQLFARVYRDVLRRRLAVDDDLRPYLTAWLQCGYGIGRLEELLYDARRFAGTSPWWVRFDPAAIAAAVREFLEADAAPGARAAFGAQVPTRTKAKAAVTRLDTVAAICRAFAARGDLPELLRDLDDAAEEGAGNLFSYFDTSLPVGPYTGAAARLRDAFLGLADVAVPLGAAVAQLFTPLVGEALQAHKRGNGLYDFDDMLALVAESLEGAHGPELIRLLRGRYHCAFIDEFQDTDPVQWRIFRTLFADKESTRPLVIVGDPKQAIYGFRGADVRTYLAARRELASDGEEAALHLTRNFRSTPAIVEAYNAILDQQAGAPFFAAAGEIRYEHPVSAALPAGAAPRPAVTLLSLVSPTPGKVRARDVRRALTGRIAREIRALIDPAAGSSAAAAPAAAVRPGDIFVLTRMLAEAQAVGAALRQAGVPYTLFKQDGLFQTPEASEVLDLLAAIEDPADRSKRARAWLTPFFALALGDLPDCAALPADHPLVARLFAWKELADDHRFESLFHRILDDSGVIRRELFAGAGERRLTNYQHIFDRLLEETAGGRRGLRDLIIQLGGFIDDKHKPDPEDGNVQRRESDRDAVQIMTMHKAKGLEAEVVFLYGGFSPYRGGYRKVRTFSEDGQRVVTCGRPRRAALDEKLKSEQAQDDQRLLYVALTRARSRLYLPYFGGLPEADEELEGPSGGPEPIEWRVLRGGYRHVNRRLRALIEDPVFRDERRSLFDPQRVPCPPEDGDGDSAARAAARGRALRAWRPPADLLGDDGAAEASARVLDNLRRRRAGFAITSYTRLKQRHGGYQAPEDPLDDGLGDAPLDAEAEAAADAATPAPAGGPAVLPGGARSGIFLHAVLETVPLEALKTERPGVDAWLARPDVQAVFAREMSRFDRRDEHLGDAARLVHAALTTPVALSAARTLPGIASAEQILREVEFVYPVASGGGASPDFVKGFIDFVIEVDGRTYLGDWKSDHLPAWDAATLGAHVEANYAIQARLYAIALVKMLGITGPDDYEARFGGMLFVFLRGLPGGIFIWRPSHAEVTRWRDELGAIVAARDAREREEATS